MTVMVTGAAGFIGFHASRRLLENGQEVVGIDTLNTYYDPKLKAARLEQLQAYKGFSFHVVDIADETGLRTALAPYKIRHILHLAAQAGVRHSIDNPQAYMRANFSGHLNILEFARHCDSLDHLVYASSSSVYGDRESGAFAETDRVRSPVSLYAASKLSNELMSESYHALFAIPQTGLRFFTVYGPWGRPDMAYFSFTKKILAGKPIELFAPEDMSRDFTYIDDIVGVFPKILETPPEIGHAIYNLGNSNPNRLMEFVDVIEQACGVKAEKVILGKQKGDVSTTFADTSAAERDFGFRAKTSLEVGIPKFVDWYRAFYGV